MRGPNLGRGGRHPAQGKQPPLLWDSSSHEAGPPEGRGGGSRSPHGASDQSEGGTAAPAGPGSASDPRRPLKGPEGSRAGRSTPPPGGEMALCGRGLRAAWALLLLATPFLAQGSDGFPPTVTAPGSLPETTEERGFFKKIYHAAKGLMWRDSHKAITPTANRSSSLPRPTRKQMESQFLQTIEFNENLTFSLRVLNEDLSAGAVPEVHAEGSVIHVEANIQASPGVFPRLFIEECYGADAPHHSHARRIDIIVNNHGCLHGGDPEIKWFRKTDSSIIFKLPAFLLMDGSEEIYLHCLLTAWSQKLPTSPGKKMCVFDGASSRWKNLDELSKSSVCNCCDSFCHQEPPPQGNLKVFSGEGMSRRQLLGPLKVHKEDVSWLEGKCRTTKRMLLVSVAFVCSCLLAAIFVGVLAALILAVLHHSGTLARHRGLRNQKEQPFHTELQTMMGACIETEEIEKESNMDYCKLKSDTAEKE